MPTAAKLVAGVIFAVLAFFAAQAYAAQLPATSSPAWMREIAAVTGAVLGWSTLGAKGRHQNFGKAAGAGLRTSLFIVIWALLFLAIYLMLKRSISGKYHGFVEALLSVFDIFYAQGRLLVQPDVLLILLAGGVLGGLATEWAARRFT